MCGIMGYVGHDKKGAKIVFDGLKRLEYRGYDSWGVALAKEGKLALYKKIGKIGNVNPKFPKTNIAIGHTRWATHGGVTEQNAHPHLDCTGKITLVHNGIVENYKEIKKELLKKGHRFVSETDTEVIVHLIEENIKTNKFKDSIVQSFKRLKGLNAIVVCNLKNKEIAAVKNGTPIVVGIGQNNDYFISSDIIGISKYTNRLIFLEDGQMILIGDQISLFDIKLNKQISPKINNIKVKLNDEKKGKYKYFLQKEIYEQPKVISQIALNFESESKKLAKLIKSANGIFLVGCGSASFVCLAGTYLFSNIAKIHLNFTTGSEFKYLEDYLTNKTLVIPISQSGETIDILDSVKKAKNKKSKISAITNVLGASLYRVSDYNFLIGAGVEKAVLATKSVTAMLSVLYYVAYSTIGQSDLAKEKLLLASKNITEILKDKYITKIKTLAKLLENKKDIYVIGRGLSYAVSLETALKIKELSYIHAEGFAGGELKHGAIALIEKGTPCIVIISNDETKDEIISNAMEIKARGGFIIGIGSIYDDVFDIFLNTDDLGYATMLPQIVIAQLLTFYITLLKGYDIDKPRNLAKSVTVK
ncbi:MAG: glutamine--fructose-6-phosphate transaminase (isomerizing) [bacterium]